ncbi:MAG: hypothetical protein JWO82_470 [Akkermansiaceae bacterium]|nr:hypothetical protein [Akkermansiaceae bacterium]
MKSFSIIPLLSILALTPVLHAAGVDMAEIARLRDLNSKNLDEDLKKAEAYFRRGIAGQLAAVDRVEIYQLSAASLPPAEAGKPADDHFVIPTDAFKTAEVAIEKKQQLDAKELAFFKTEMSRILQVAESPVGMPGDKPVYGVRAWCKDVLILETGLTPKAAKTPKDPKELLFSVQYPQLGYRCTGIQAPAALQTLLDHVFPVTVKK